MLRPARMPLMGSLRKETVRVFARASMSVKGRFTIGRERAWGAPAAWSEGQAQLVLAQRTANPTLGPLSGCGRIRP